MRNVIKYYYELVPETIHQISNSYRFNVNGNDYFFQKIENINYDFNDLYNLNNYLLNNGFYCHQIILNVNKEVITIVNNNFYILLKILIQNRVVNIDDIKYFSRVQIGGGKYKNLEKYNWYDLWTKKIDYIEYQLSQFGKKYSIIRNSINYYIGLAENSISLLSNVNIEDQRVVVSHRRIESKSKIYNFYNPINFIIDSKVRDLSEYYKECFFDGCLDLEKLKINIMEYEFTSNEIILFFARMIFPTYYFDCYQSILLGEDKDISLLKYISKAQEYELFLKELYLFLRKFYNIPEIEWIIKTQTSSLR